MIEVEIQGNAYRTAAKLPVMAQFHVTRRLGPLLAYVGITLAMLKKGMEVSLDDWLPLAGPVAEVMAKMSDEDLNYVVFNCLQGVQRRQGDKWAPVMAGGSSAFMFDDIDLPVMGRLVIEVLKDNLGNFLTGLAEGTASPSSSPAAGQQGARTS